MSNEGGFLDFLADPVFGLVRRRLSQFLKRFAMSNVYHRPVLKISQSVQTLQVRYVRRSASLSGIGDFLETLSSIVLRDIHSSSQRVRVPTGSCPRPFRWLVSRGLTSRLSDHEIVET